jgi:catechol 2,3-dioxygenase-like lactoylglutathione lyase family enzyme
MLGNSPVAPTIPVTDIGKAHEFYVGTLGLKEIMKDEAGGLMLAAGGGSMIYVYERGASKADHTLASFKVDDIDQAIDELASKGVTMEHYDEGLLKTDDKGVAVMGDTKGAWFKDPFGNILAITQM